MLCLKLQITENVTHIVIHHHWCSIQSKALKLSVTSIFTALVHTFVYGPLSGAGISRCLDDPLVVYSCCLNFGRFVFSWKLSSFLISILWFWKDIKTMHEDNASLARIIYLDPLAITFSSSFTKLHREENKYFLCPYLTISIPHNIKIVVCRQEIISIYLFEYKC